jgi:hypothetical protein
LEISWKKLATKRDAEYPPEVVGFIGKTSWSQSHDSHLYLKISLNAPKEGLIMRVVRDVCVLLFVLFFSLSSLALAEVEKGASKTIKLEAKPIDMTMTADGKYTFILAEGGKVLIVDSSGTVSDTLKVSDSAVSIATSPDGSFLLLADNKANTLDVVQISFVVDIDISGLPFKGPAAAPVVIAMFSDYQ